MDSNDFMDENFIMNLLKVLRGHKSIKHLHLHVCNISPSNSIEDCLNDSLLNDKFISRLCLSKSIISHQLTQAHRSLIHLELYKNQIQADDLSQLQSLSENDSLIHLIISEKSRRQFLQEDTKDELKRGEYFVNELKFSNRQQFSMSIFVLSIDRLELSIYI